MDRRRTRLRGGGIVIADALASAEAHQDDRAHMRSDQPAGPPAVELQGITKRFPGVVANHDIHLPSNPQHPRDPSGRTAPGKSTLMKILYGMYRPDEGQILVGGAPVSFSSPHQAIRAGIGMVHQPFPARGQLHRCWRTWVLGAERIAGSAAAPKTRCKSISDQ
jgi:simple sugar transport system ATP-binding protein